jgi:predicted nucleic acid-binding protein
MISQQVLLDSSVWITYLRPGCPPALMKCIQNHLVDQNVVCTRLISLELLTGVKDERMYDGLRDRLSALALLEEDEAHWDIACRLGYDLRRKGITVPTVDITIAASAIRHGAKLLHQDRHFDAIARHSQLKIESFPA